MIGLAEVFSNTIQFLGVGPQRTGSTWLYEALKNHPEISWPAEVKETYFFDQRFERGFVWYYRHFAESHQRVMGEIGPTYFDSPEAAERIKEHSPNCKIIINVRNPIEKTYSLFRHYYSSGLVPIDFELAIQREPRIIDSGHYKKHSLTWETLFGKEQVLYITQDDIREQPEVCLSGACQFLNVSNRHLLEVRSRVNVAAAPIWPGGVWLLESLAKMLRTMHLHRLVNFGKQLGLKRLYQGGRVPTPMTRAQFLYLLEEFRDDINWLEDRLGRDLSTWIEFKETQESNV